MRQLTFPKTDVTWKAELLHKFKKIFNPGYADRYDSSYLGHFFLLGQCDPAAWRPYLEGALGMMGDWITPINLYQLVDMLDQFGSEVTFPLVIQDINNGTF